MPIRLILILLAPLLISACTLPPPCGVYDGQGMAYTKCMAGLGHISYQMELANAYYEGTGVEQDYKRAARWYKRAAAFRSGTTYVYSPPVGNAKYGMVMPIQTGLSSAGSLQAKYRLAEMYRDGLGVKQDEKKAAKWLKRASRQGSEPLEFYLQQLNQMPSPPEDRASSSHDEADHN